MKAVPILLLLFTVLRSNAQQPTDKKPDYPQNYFRNPLDIPIFLAGNFGECRPGHFHSGVDIKTKGVENIPVHAAADGYVSRIKMEPGGFGHGLYITHPNGYTTLYAHLNKFVPEIQQYVEQQQYAHKRWDVDLQFQPDQFPVKQGQQIAWSGNTGASTAPHLHFEIRNTKTEHPLNPELFGLPIVDKIPPTPADVVIYTDNPHGVGFYDDDRLILPVEKKDSIYRLARHEMISANPALVHADGDTVTFRETNNILIGVNVDDHMDGSDNTIAFYTMELFIDDSLRTKITLDDIGYDETRNINAYADYKIKQQQNKWVQCLFKLPGNHLDRIYSHMDANNSLLALYDNEPRSHKIDIVITDDKGNQSRIAFYTKHKMIKPDFDNETARNIIFHANEPNQYKDSAISLSLDGRALYSDIAFFTQTTSNPQGYSDKHQVHYPYVPVHTYFELDMKPSRQIPAGLESKVAMIYSDNKEEDGRAAKQTDNGWYKARVRNFGIYWLEIDTIPPVITSQQKNNANLSKATRITFEVKDDKTSVKTFSGYLDGKWICFEQHNNLFFYNFDKHCPKGKHHLAFKAADENGNERTYDLTFTR